jgi:hypothetical protein
MIHIRLTPEQRKLVERDAGAQGDLSLSQMVGIIVKDRYSPDVTHVRLTPELREGLERAARDDFDRSIGAMVGRIVAEWLDAHGYVKRPAPPKPNLQKKGT